MNSKNDLTTGNVKKTMLMFVLPYLFSCFLQTFYGLADLFIVGLYNGPETSSAVSIGSQVMHMFTVIIVGMAMGTTVQLGHSIGAKKIERAKRVIGNSAILFIALAFLTTILLLLTSKSITTIMMTPVEAVSETNQYLKICFAGIPFIIAYNVISSIYRGVGDSKSPMIFAFIACIVNILIDFLFIGAFGLGAAGAAFGTIIGQGVSVLISILFIKKLGLGFSFELGDLKVKMEDIRSIVGVGFPIAMQDGLIQIAFIIITVIANSRGLIDSTSVGVVEKIISFLFLVPSAFLSAISAITAQNMGAGKENRAKESLWFGLTITVSWGIICCIYCQFLPQTLIGLFRNEADIISAGSAYLRAYSIDCIIAAIHFCFSGYFCGRQKSGISFLHNILSVVLIRVPGAYLASLYFPDNLYPMGLAAPCGSFLSVLICVGFYLYYCNKDNKGKIQSLT